MSVNKTPISIIVVNYNSSNYVEDLLKSVDHAVNACKACSQIEVVIVDNASNYKDYCRLKQIEKEYTSQGRHTIVRVLRLSRNYGYAGAVNIGIKFAKGDIIIVSNPDIILEKDFLDKLTKLYSSPLIQLLERSIIAPKILLEDGYTVNSTGMVLHIAGYGMLLNLNAKRNEPKVNKPKLVLAPHGALFISLKRILLELGPFDPYYFAFLEDLDLGIRAYLKGYYVIYIPILVARHRWGVTWGRRLSKNKYYYAERNRIITLLKNIPLKHLVTIIPFLAASEAVSIAYAISSKYPSMKARVYADILRSIKCIKQYRAQTISGNNIEQYLPRLTTIEFTHVVFNNKYVHIMNKIYGMLSKTLNIPLLKRAN